MKLGQLIEYNKRNIFLQKLCGKWGRETSPSPLFTFWKSWVWGKRKWSAAYFQYVSISFNLVYNKNKLYETLNNWSRDMLNFDFSYKDLGLVSPSYFVYDFSRKMSLVFHSINRPNFIIWLPSLLKRFGNMCITIVC